ncbi:MAG: SapC family protein [Planctomycetota bacterium]
MAKQLLIYESAVPVNSDRHRDACLEPAPNYAFTQGINVVPLMAVEMMPAAPEYAIVFLEAENNVMPVAILGMRPDQNLYLTAESQWSAKYIPAFIRRYPFVFAMTPAPAAAEGKTEPAQQMMTLCVDETYPGFNREGRGQRLFGEDGKPTKYVEDVLNFLKEFQMQFERTRLFGKKLKDLNLLEPMQAQVAPVSGDKITLGGFHGVNRSRLKTLSPEALSQLCQTDELELIYLHLHSLQNFGLVKDRFVATLPAPEAAAK